MKWFGWILIGIIIGAALVWQFRVKPCEISEQQKKEWAEQIQAARDSIESLQGVNDELLAEVQSSKQNIERLNRRIAALIQAGQDQDNDIVLLPADETVKMFDSLTGDFWPSVIVESDSNSVLTHLERIRKANRAKVGLYFTLQESAVKSLLIASQDSIINSLEGVNLNQGIQLGQKDRIIALKDQQLNEYESVIDQAAKRRKIDNWIKAGLIIGLVVVAF